MTTESGRCLTCGHDLTAHRMLTRWMQPTGDWECHPGCTCPKFEPTQGGDAIAAERTGDRSGSGGHVTGPATATPPAVAGPPPPGIYRTDADWDFGGDADDEREPPLLERVPWRIGVLDKDLLEDPDTIRDEAYRVAGWYVHDCAELLEQLQPAATPRPALSYGCTCPGGDQHDPANPACRYGQIAAVRPPDLDGDFYEDDEPISQIRAILERPPDGVTGPPAVCRCGHDLDCHTGSFTTGQHCRACSASQPCAGWNPTEPRKERDAVADLPAVRAEQALRKQRLTTPATDAPTTVAGSYTPPPVDATPVALAAARGAVDLVERLEREVERLKRAARAFLEEAVSGKAPIGNWDGFNAAADELRAALDLGAAPEEAGAAQRRQIVGYQTADGRLYRPDDIVIIYETPAGDG